MLLLSAVFPSVGRDDNCAGEANIVWAATEFVEVQTTASLIRVPFPSRSTFSSPDRIWFGLLSPRVGEKGPMFRPISAGGRAALRSASLAWMALRLNRRVSLCRKALLMLKSQAWYYERFARSNDCWTPTFIFLRRISCVPSRLAFSCWSPSQ
jgi:hypothetical protein